jgi:tRNA isopentenyl-2-thiomethyl-A-37 hydroxylase MiaE
LGLRTDTSARWLAMVDEHLDDVPIDHAHCEKKAAGVALNLIFSYVERTELVLSGGTQREDLVRYAYRPDLIVDSVASLCHDEPLLAAAEATAQVT